MHEKPSEAFYSLIFYNTREASFWAPFFQKNYWSQFHIFIPLQLLYTTAASCNISKSSMQRFLIIPRKPPFGPIPGHFEHNFLKTRFFEKKYIYIRSILWTYGTWAAFSKKFIEIEKIIIHVRSQLFIIFSQKNIK